MSTIYSSFKILQFQEQIEALKKGSVLAPIHIRIKPINACNHHCWCCAYRADNLTLGASMRIADRIPENKMEEIVQDIIDMGVKAVTFSGGGEPLLYPTIADTMERLSQNKVQVGCLTNGALLTGKKADIVAEHCTWIRISMDGWDNQSYLKSRGASEHEFEKIISNIKEFNKKTPKCELGVSFIVTKENSPHIFELCSLLKSIGVKSIKISGCVVSDSGSENENYHVPIFNNVREQIKMAKSLNDKNFTIVDHYHIQMQSFDKPYQFCPSLTFLTVIAADCSVYTCQDKSYTENGRLGSIKDRGFRDFWFSDEANAARASINPQSDCRTHCVAHQKNLLLAECLDLDTKHLSFV